MTRNLIPFLLLTFFGRAWSNDDMSLVEQKILDMENEKSFGIVLSLYERPEGTKVYRLGLIQGATSIETSNLTQGEYAYFAKGIESTLSQSSIIAEEAPCGSKLRLRQALGSIHTLKCYNNAPEMVESIHDWVVLTREFVWMKKSQKKK
ncbi:MAG: hypothetical protein A2X86_15225 [Bdellovibrionales bacterium GWA2_49_15]|nr:MAG: hypothetical protein A2X86_15225 [Bdellovibrionales bacterium GWA2_49_15]HAZ13303.1 hypothetical protein [Bdellovibrionales bacterium]